MQVVYSLAATADLTSIQRYIAERNPRAASRVAVQLIAACDSLEHFPYKGRAGSAAGTRELVVGPHVIVYEAKRSHVQVLRIYHGRQDR